MVKLVTFASKEFYYAMDTLVEEAWRSGFFNAVNTYKEDGLPAEMRDYAKQNRRGYGYWRWKPMICYASLAGMHDGGVLVYADAGCAINADGDLERWIDLAGDSVLSFELDSDKTERKYTKKAVFDAIDGSYAYIDTPQIMATVFVMRKNKSNVDFIKHWTHLALNKPDLFDDTHQDEDEQFIDHRHDQSVFSLMRKQYECPIIPDETYHDEHNVYDQNAPIWAMRRRR